MKKRTSITAKKYFKDTEFGHLMRKMCDFIDLDFDSLELKPNKEGGYQWPFSDHTWTEKRQEEFIDWFVEYYKNNPKARRALIEHSTLYSNEKRLRKAAGKVLLDYGWRIAEDGN